MDPHYPWSVSVKAIILFSGGIDSTVVLAMALQNGRQCHALSFDYGQRHHIELQAAAAITKHYGISHQIIKIDPSAFGNSALVSPLVSAADGFSELPSDASRHFPMDIPTGRSMAQIASLGIPSSYVPARNMLFLAFAAGQAELWKAGEIYFGANAADSAPYPDCRPAFIAAIQGVLDVATKEAVEGHPPKLIAPLSAWHKPEIIRQGSSLNVPFALTHSCYAPAPQGMHCGRCDACVIRQEAFSQAMQADPTSYLH